MIRRTLITRLRRHTRLARALAGRSPLAVRAAVDQPILWAIGRASAPPRRARAPLLVAPSFELPPEPGEDGSARSAVVPYEPVEDGSATPALNQADLRAPVDPGGGRGEPMVPGAPHGATARVETPGVSVATASASVERMPAQSVDVSAVTPPDLANSALMTEGAVTASPSDPAKGAPSGVAPPASVRGDITPDAPQPPAPESVSSVPSASPEDAATFDRSPAAWMERLRADEQRHRQQETAAPPAPVKGDTTPDTPQPPAQESVPAVPSASPEDVATFDRSPAAWMERLRADEQHRQQETAAPSAPVKGDTTPDTPQPPSQESVPAVPSASPEDVAPFDRSPAAWMERLHADEQRHRQQETAAPPAPVEGGIVLPPVVPPAPVEGGIAAPPTITRAPDSAAPSAIRPEAQSADTSQPADPVAAVVDVARAWVAQRMQERSSLPQQQPAPPPAAPNPQTQPQTPVEMRVARPPRFAERTPRASPSAAPSSPVEKSPATDRPSAETPPFDRSVEAWMERLRADERRRQKEAAQSPDRSSVETSQPLPDAPPAAQPAEESQSGGVLWAESGRRQPRPGSQPTGASQPGIAAPPTRATRFAPPVGAAVRSTAPGGARLPASPAPSAPPLSESNRRFLRAAVGIDPATVRLLRGQNAGRLTSAYRADAVTIGDDVALAPGKGDETAEGLGLLAHELTHVARRRDPTAIPPIVRPPEQRPGFRTAPLGPATDEEALARTVEAQTVRAARVRFAPPVLPGRAEARAAQPFDKQDSARTAPPVLPGRAEAQAAQPFDKQESARTAPSVEDAPAAPDRGRWGNLPAPWEPLPDWLAPSRSAEAPPLPVVTVAPAPPAFTTAPQPGAPMVHAAETARTLPAPQQRETPSQEQTPAPAPDIDALARQVYAVLKRRLAAERRRSGWS